MRFELNKKKPENYAFYDAESRLHLTLSHPVDQVARVTSGIRRGLSSKVIICLDKEEVPSEDPQKTTPSVDTPVIEEVKTSIETKDPIVEEVFVQEEITEAEQVEEAAVEATEVAEMEKTEEVKLKEPVVEAESATKKKGKKSAKTEE